jgi:hypothetical protein
MTLELGLEGDCVMVKLVVYLVVVVRSMEIFFQGDATY